MNTVSPYCLVQMDHAGHRNKTLAPGIVIEIQKHLAEQGFNKRVVNCDRGWIKVIPKATEVAGCPVTVKIGSYVFFHFHTLSPLNEVWIDGDLYYKVHYSNIFFEYTDENEILPLNKYIFTEILFDNPQTSLFLFNPQPPKPYTYKSKVAVIPPHIDSVDVGDVVYHKANSNYDIEMPDGRVFYRVRESEIIGEAKV